MELSDLNIFRTVVESGGITRAAEKLHRVQSNITTRISQLEDDLGVKLFVREGKKMRLSPAGRTLLEGANRLLELARETREAVQDDTPRGLLRLGAGESTAAIRLPGPLTEFNRRYPLVSIELRTGNPPHLLEKVITGELDAALMIGPANDERIEMLPLFEEELVVVGPKGSAKLRSTSELIHSPLLAFEHGCPYRLRFEQLIARESGTPARIVEMSSYHALLGCVVAGMGYALIPASVLPSFPGRKHLSEQPMPGGQAKIGVALAWRKEMHSSRVRALADILLAEAKSIKAGNRKKR